MARGTYNEFLGDHIFNTKFLKPNVLTQNNFPKNQMFKKHFVLKQFPVKMQKKCFKNRLKAALTKVRVKQSC